MPKIVNYLNETGLSAYALDFLEASKLQSYEARAYGQRLATIMNTPYFMEQIVSHTAELGHGEAVALPAGSTPPAAQGLAQLAKHRRSTRAFSPAGLTLAEVGHLLRLAYGITDASGPQRGLPPTRTIASGGGLYPIEVYYVSCRTQGLRPGVYHYNLSNDALERLPGLEDEAELTSSLNAAFFADRNTDMEHHHASGYLVLGGVLNRVCFKYLDRGLRFALLDAGAITHSIYLASAALGIGCCGMGSFHDDNTSRLIGFQGPAQQALGVVVLGKQL